MKRTLCGLMAVLLLLVCGCAPEKEQASEPAAAPAEGMELSESTLRRRQDVDTLLICAVAYDDDNHSTLTSLSLLVKDEAGIAMLTIPKDTWVWVEQYDQSGAYSYCKYGPIREVYYAAESAGLAERKTVEAVSSLLGGVRIDRFAFLNVVQLKEVAALTDGVYLEVEDSISEFSIPAGFQNIVPNIAGYAEYSYLNNIGGTDYPGTDLYKLQRHQQLIASIMQTLAGQMSARDDEARAELAQQVCACLRTDLTCEEVEFWLDGGALDFTQTDILEGRQDERRSDCYWIPDKIVIKDWVLEHFYLSQQD